MLFVCVCALICLTCAVEATERRIDRKNAIPMVDLPSYRKGGFRREVLHRSKGKHYRIVRGSIAKPHSHPYQALLYTDWDGETGICGGCLISQRTVLSAAHCVFEAGSSEVILGAHNRIENEPSQQIQNVNPSNYRIHYRYNTRSHVNDIAILLLPNRVTLNQYVSLASLPTPYKDHLFVGIDAIISGYGKMGDNLPPSDVLRHTRNKIAKNSYCKRLYGVMADTAICVSTKQGSSVCQGDSGGPLTASNKDGKVFVLGLASYGHESCESGYPVVFTRLTSYLKWIEKNMI